MILVIDNYDSFTYNLVDLLHPYDEVNVVYPDDPTLYHYQPDVVVISPGPGHPNDTTHLAEIIEHFKHLPILGICLGAQALYCYYGGTVQWAKGDAWKNGSITIPNTITFIRKYIRIFRYYAVPFTYL